MGISGQRKLLSLRIRSVKHLSLLLKSTPKELTAICAGIDKYPEKYYFFQKKNIKGKLRNIATPQGRFREITNRLNSLFQRIQFPENMHGGLKGHTVRDYAGPHVRKRIVVKSDIKDFFPNIRPHHVYDAFVNDLQCSPDVASIITRLTTVDGQLPQGSPTSTVVANIISINLANRIDGLAKSVKGDSGTFVDDIVISGGNHVRKLKPILKRIISQEGFTPHDGKTNEFSADMEQVIAGIRVNKGIDVPQDKIQEIRRAIKEIQSEIIFGKPIDPKTLSSIKGKIRYVSSLNKGAANFLLKQLNKVLLSSPNN
jgi:RNA-directed DNA polymerase